MSDRDWKARIAEASLDQLYNLMVELGWRRSQPSTGETLWTSPRCEDLPVDPEEFNSGPPLDEDREDPVWLTTDILCDAVEMFETLSKIHDVDPGELVGRAIECPDDRSWKESDFRVDDDEAFREQTTIPKT